MKRKHREGDQAELPFAVAESERASATTSVAEPPPARPRRVFLGWDAPALPLAAEWLLEFQEDLADVVVAVPGARAARRLRELLARRAQPAWRPPRVLTQGELTDELVLLDRPVAGRLARTLAWKQALAALPPDDLALLGRNLHGREAEALARAELVRTLHGELAPEGVAFERLAHGPWRPEPAAEAARWEALSRAQERYRALLDELGLADPHEARLEAIEAGRVDSARRVVLVGVADMNHLLARLVARIPERVTTLVVAPESEAASFDELGRLRTEAWRARDVPLALASWRVAEKPVDQAAAVGAALAGFEGRFAADEVVIGVADEEVVPYLERQVASTGARTRRAAGTSMEAAPPFRLLRAIERFLATRRFAELAALARDPELAPELLRDDDAPNVFDRYHSARLPLDLPAPPPPARPAGDGKRAKHEAELARIDRAVATFQARLLDRLGELASPSPRALVEWAGPLRAFLESVYARPLDPSAEPERLRAEALRLVGAALGELETLPAALHAATVTAASALALLLGELRGKRLPPAVDGEARVELLGWLDLPLDDAPAVVVTGFEEGRVPRSIGAHPFLPDGIRRKLGLPTDGDRLARDVYATTVLLASRAASVFVTGRRNGVGDPLVPSRLAFHRPESEIAAAVRHFLPPEEEPAPPRGDQEDDPRPPPPFVRASVELPQVMRVTSFKDYLASPYLYYLRHVERLDTLDDRAHELEPLGFGNLAHEVLQELGSHGPQGSDEAALRAFLLDTLSTAAAERFRGNALPAVEIQLEQLRHRLGLFAKLEAERRRAGWRIHAVEWTLPEERAVLEVDGVPQRLSGRIDRIDVHADGRWAILDYKAGENPADPRQVRRRDGTWTDLQLPLYRHVTRGLFPGEPELGYVSLGKDEAGVRLELGRWSAADLDEALEVARDVVRRVRARDFAEIGEKVPYEPIFRSLLGESMLEGEGADE